MVRKEVTTMCKDCAASDLSKLEPVFKEFEGDGHALVTIDRKSVV